MLSRPEKRSFKKVHKIEIFQRAQSMAFVKKIRLFIIYVFWANQARKDRFLVILDKKILSTPEKETFKKVQKFEIFQKGQSIWFLSKNRTFCHLCLLGKSSQKRSFFGILDKKECSLDQKKEVLKNDKKSTFSKGVSPQFLSKN